MRTSRPGAFPTGEQAEGSGEVVNEISHAHRTLWLLWIEHKFVQSRNNLLDFLGFCRCKLQFFHRIHLSTIDTVCFHETYASYRWYKVESQPTTAFTIQNTWCWSQLSVTGPRGCQNGQRSSSKRRRGRRRGRWGHDEKPVVNATTRHSGLCVGVFLPVLVFFLIVRQVTRYYMYFDILYNILYVYWFWIYSISVYAFLKRVSRVSSLLFFFWVYSSFLPAWGGPLAITAGWGWWATSRVGTRSAQQSVGHLSFNCGFCMALYQVNMK